MFGMFVERLVHRCGSYVQSSLSCSSSPSGQSHFGRPCSAFRQAWRPVERSEISAVSCDASADCC